MSLKWLVPGLLGLAFLFPMAASADESQSPDDGWIRGTISYSVGGPQDGFVIGPEIVMPQQEEMDALLQAATQELSGQAQQATANISDSTSEAGQDLIAHGLEAAFLEEILAEGLIEEDALAKAVSEDDFVEEAIDASLPNASPQQG